MFGSHKRIFAGKPKLHSQPLCPYMTDSNGYFSLGRTKGFREEGLLREKLPLPQPKRGLRFH